MDIQSTIQQVINGLTPLAQKLQFPISQLWSWALQNNYAQAIDELALFVFIVILTIVFGLFIKWGFSKKKNENGYLESRFEYDSVIVFTSVVLGFSLLIILGFSIFSVFSDAIPRLIAPQFHALQDIIQLLPSN